MFELVGCNYFLSALDDPGLHIRILDQQPKTLDECLVKATQMEAFSKSVQSSGESRGSCKGVRPSSRRRRDRNEFDCCHLVVSQRRIRKSKRWRKLYRNRARS